MRYENGDKQTEACSQSFVQAHYCLDVVRVKASAMAVSSRHWSIYQVAGASMQSFGIHPSMILQLLDVVKVVWMVPRLVVPHLSYASQLTVSALRT